MIFIALSAGTVAVPVMAHLLAAQRIRAPGGCAQAWLQANNAAAMSVLLLVIGVTLFGKGLGRPVLTVTAACQAAVAAEPGVHHLDRRRATRLINGQQAGGDEVERADEPVREAEPACTSDRIAQPCRPAVLDEQQRRGGAVRNVLKDVPVLHIRGGRPRL